MNDFHQPQWRQRLMKLSHIVAQDSGRRLVEIPDRATAEEHLARLKREYKAALVAAKIMKIGAGKSGTYTIAYTVRETRTEELF